MRVQFLENPHLLSKPKGAKEHEMRIGIFGLPNSGKSQFRRWLVGRMHEAGGQVEHWDADRFKKARCPEDADMREPADEPGVIWVIEDVRGTVPHKSVIQPGEKEGAWKPLSFYNLVYYLNPDWSTYAAFWVSRALQWKKLGAGNWMRESGWENLDDEEIILRKVQYFLAGREAWIKEDMAVLSRITHPLVISITPVWKADGEIEWQGLTWPK